jgi:HptB-dependent secretion and biofilm anti anti-sigma factor
MNTNFTTDNETAVIRLSGRFDFSRHREFRNCYEAALKEPTLRRIDVDLQGVDYLDSSALGMLLLLREHAGRSTKRVSIRNARPHVERVLTVANFHKLFVMA